MKYKGKMSIILLITLVLITVCGCSLFGNNEPKKNGNTSLELPVEIENWIENSKKIFLGQAYEYKDKLYILVTYGEKPTGGYTVEVVNIDDKPEALEITVKFSEPEPSQMVTQAITHPYDLKTINPTEKEIVFNAEGSESYLPTLRGISKLEPIAAGKDGIMVFEPVPESKTGKSVSFRGIANTFEGTVNYRLETMDDKELLEGFTTGAMGDWGYFEETIEVPDAAPNELKLRVFTYSAKDGSMQDEFEIPFTVSE